MNENIVSIEMSPRQKLSGVLIQDTAAWKMKRPPAGSIAAAGTKRGADSLTAPPE
jgi:hypothetical protein